MKHNAIAIVDDMEFLVEAFQSVGISLNVDAYTNGRDFLEAVMTEEALPLLTILDYNMPYLTGEAVLIEMRKHPGFSDTKVVVLSTGMHTALESRLMELGAYCCIAKPVTAKGYHHIAEQLKEILVDVQQGKVVNLNVFKRSEVKRCFL